MNTTNTHVFLQLFGKKHKYAVEVDVVNTMTFII